MYASLASFLILSVAELLLIENTILTLGKSYNEIAQIKSNNNIEEIPPINDNEFKQKYVESLEAYQNGNWNISLDGFIYLLTLDKNNDLSDNCQYWIAEIYYKMKHMPNLNNISAELLDAPACRTTSEPLAH